MALTSTSRPSTNTKAAAFHMSFFMPSLLREIASPTPAPSAISA